ncbi:O-antigen ligase [Sphingomonas sp. AOB5]|uniref:O-antigen ligase family protein n=1 Tax=Sphingomonas sp. AOB5 TaxID=3034017 RepID=UPI0023F7D375|nr:O-antigen ligase [Sphingomonas sp. AOB5]MDF7774426.1 O-antigen ligase [Sphingomonas sp. AOB5]
MDEGELNRPGATPGEARLAPLGLMQPTVLLPLLLLLAAFLFGGAAAGQPLRDLAVGVVALVVLAAVAAGWIGRSFSPSARWPLILIGALALLFVVQLVPLPFGMWSSLAGRGLSANVLDLIGAPHAARPLSVDPELTVLAALAVIPGVAMAVAVMRMGARQRLVLVWACVALALASLVFGVLQASFGAQAGTITLYRQAHTGLPIGVFANANHQADLLVIGFVFAGIFAPPIRSAIAERRLDRSAWLYGVMFAFAAGVVACGSRSGIALIGLGLLAIVVRERLAGHIRTIVFGGIGLVGALALLVAFNPIFARAFADFSNADDGRFHFWPNVLYAIGEFGWTGTGAGSFDGVYRSVETLDTLSERFLNHAHNDYLEILLEMGIPGALLLVAFLVVMTIRVIRRPMAGIEGRLAYAGLTCAGLVLLHSMADYPLRTPLLSVVFGLCCALLVDPPASGEKPRIAGAWGWARIAGVLIGTGWLGYVTIAYGLTASALEVGDAKTALRIRPHSAEALSIASAQALARNDTKAAESYARASLMITPRDVRALRVLGIAAVATRRQDLGSQLMLRAGALGWRDEITQVWLIRAALADNNYTTAAQRIDAMLRSRQLFEDMLRLAHDIARVPEARNELIARLVDEPGWRREFFRDIQFIAPESETSHLLLIEGLIQREGGARRSEVAPFIDHLVKKGQFGAARRLWLASRGAAAEPLAPGIVDGDFKEDPLADDQQPRYPFEWRFEAGNGGNAVQGAAPLLVGEDAMFVQASAPNIRLARQLVQVSPGARQLRYDALETENGSPDQFRWRIICAGGAELKLGLARREASGQRRTSIQDFVVPANCPALYVELHSRATTGNPAEAWFDHIAVQ